MAVGSQLSAVLKANTEQMGKCSYSNEGGIMLKQYRTSSHGDDKPSRRRQAVWAAGHERPWRSRRQVIMFLICLHDRLCFKNIPQVQYH